ncbi:hypothetical protein J5X84_28780 [Streptosporangiaceae bacterium NEAU-GS5]|nr:hypothetical protein [Streptosporangiaceae bacterium NEAU-GS5]
MERKDFADGCEGATMYAIGWAWGISAAVLVAAAGLIGWRRVAAEAGLHGPAKSLGILIDDRGRFSLTRFQITLWTILVLSLLSGLVVGRLLGGSAATAMSFPIPPELLGAMGISAGSAALATAVKSGNDATRGEQVAASGIGNPPRVSQMLMREEGAMADKIVDVGKFQNFWITLFLVGAYAVLFGNAVANAKTAADVALPGFSPGFLTLFGISHAGYIAAKFPTPTGTPATPLEAKRKLDLPG